MTITEYIEILKFILDTKKEDLNNESLLEFVELLMTKPTPHIKIKEFIRDVTIS